MILVFTSVKDGRPWYKRDLLNVCCEAQGTRIQFAYRIGWVAENLRSPEQLKGQEALIVFCERKSSGGRLFTYHPVRQAKIVDPNPEFDTMTLSLELRGFFDYDRYRGQMDNLVEKFQTYVTQSEEQPTPSDPAKARFVRVESVWEKAAFTESWTPLIDHVRNLDGLNDSIFFCVQNRSEFGGPPSPLFPNPVADRNKTTYVLKSGASYEVSLHVIEGSQATFQDPELVVKDAVGSVSGPFVRQRSAGLQADFVLRCKRSFEEDTCMVSLRVPRSQPNSVRSPEIHALLKLGVRKGILLVAVSMLTIGGFLVSLTPDLASDLAHWVGGDDTSWIAVHRFSVSALSKLLGLAALAIGSYIGFRKLPSKE